MVENVATQLIDHGSVQRGFLGVSFGPVSETLSQALNIPRGAAQITDVNEGTAAEKAGLREGDIVVAVNDQQLHDANQLRTIIGNMRPGDEVRLTFIRDGEERTVTVTLGVRPDDLNGRSDTPRLRENESEQGVAALGLLRLQNATPELLERLGVEDANVEGVVIVEIDRNSAAYREAELRQGDIIVEVDRRRVTSRSEFMDVYRSIDAGESFLVRVLRPQNNDLVSFLTALEKP